MSLARLVAEASALAGGKHQCEVLGHDWQSVGGRACPFDCGASQTVYRCRSCNDWDYGYPGGPAYRECVEAGPCQRECTALIEGNTP